MIERVAIRVALLVALATSAMLLADYLLLDPAFCVADTGCARVRESGYSHLAGIPLPALGALAFFALFFATFHRARRVVAAMLVLTGIAGLLLLALQAVVVGAFCALCVVVDVACILAAALAIPWSRRPDAPPRIARWAWHVLLVLAIVAPLGYPVVRPPPPLPEELRALQDGSGVTIVEAMDFQCPHCRALQPRLEALVSRAPDLRLVRLHYPLPFHRHARDAALAHLCAAREGRGEAMADALLAHDPLDDDAIDRAADDAGLTAAQLAACKEDSALAATLERHRHIVDAAGFIGLPTTWVGRERILGAQPDAVFVEAIRAARDGSDGGGIPGWGYLTGVALFAGVVTRLGWRRS